MQKNLDHIDYGLSLKSDGNMKQVGGDFSFQQNRHNYLVKQNIVNETLVCIEAEHGGRVEVVCDDKKIGINNCDALLTNTEGLVLGITVADCLPVYFFDPEKKAIAIAHAGWRGLLAGIVENTIQSLHLTYKSKPENIIVIVGPHIQKNSYEVGADLFEKFKTYEQAVSVNHNKYYLDLSRVVYTILQAQGIKIHNIEISKTDTFQDERYFSYRRDKPIQAETMLAYIKFKNHVK